MSEAQRIQSEMTGLVEIYRLKGELLELRDERDRLVSAIVWALGYNNFRERQEGEGPYWWRRELMHRSGLSQADLDKAWKLEDTADKLTEVMMRHKAALTPAGGGQE